MAINKVVYNKKILMDLTEDTVSEETMITGTTAHAANGEEIVGKFDPTKYLEKTGAASNTTAAFSQASSRVNINTGEKLSVIFGKIKKFLTDLKTVAFTGSYSDLIDTPKSLLANGGNAETVNGHTVNANVPSGAKFTDTNTWRGIENNLTSDSTERSLAAAQGKALNVKITNIDNKITSSKRKLTSSNDLNTITGFQVFEWETSTPKNAPKSDLQKCTGIVYGDSVPTQIVSTENGELFWRTKNGAWHQVAAWKVQ